MTMLPFVFPWFAVVGLELDGQAVNAIAAASQGYGMVCGPGVHQAPVHPQWPPPGLLPGHPFNMAVELVAGAGDGVRPEPASGVSVESARGTGDDEPREASSKVVEVSYENVHLWNDAVGTPDSVMSRSRCDFSFWT